MAKETGRTEEGLRRVVDNGIRHVCHAGFKRVVILNLTLLEVDMVEEYVEERNNAQSEQDEKYGVVRDTVYVEKSNGERCDIVLTRGQD